MKAGIFLLAILITQCRGAEQFKYEPWSHQFDVDYNSLFDSKFVQDDLLNKDLTLFLNKEVFNSKVVKSLRLGDERVELIITTMEVGAPVFLICRNKNNVIVEAQEVVEEFEEYSKAFYSERGVLYCKEMDFERYDIPGEEDSIVIRSYHKLIIELQANKTIKFDTIKLEFPKFIKLHQDSRVKFPTSP